MYRYILRRILLSIPVLIAILFFSFLMVRLQPYGPFESTAGGHSLPENVRLMMETRYGLHRPFQEQFLIYVGNILKGDFGPLLRTRHQDVNEVISAALPVSLQLGLMSILTGLIIGVVAGIIAALRHRKPLDYAATFIAVIGISIPNLVIAPVLIYVLGLRLDWFPIAFWGADPPFTLGIFPPLDLNFFRHAALPVITLGISISATIARLTRSSLLEVLSEDYIRTARAKGLRERMVLVVHALKNALIPTVTVLGPLFVALLPGMVVIENIFGINGLARVMVDSVFQSEYFLLSGSIFVFAVILVVGNLLADILYVFLDPRISYSGSNG
jgi:oligopeptide transport system permease protein